MVILSQARKPDNFKWQNPLKLSFTNIRDLWSNLLDMNPFMNQTLLKQTWMSQLLLAISP